jgi:hypothetical protein
LPPGLGNFPVNRVEDFGGRVPAEWRERGGVFIPMYQREALWLAFDAATWKPNAVQVAVGGINAVSGDAWEEGLSDDPQNYIICPDQPWLDGINAGEGFIKQFVAMPLGMGYTVEGQLTGKEELGGVQLRVYEPRPGRFPNRPPRQTADSMILQETLSPMALAGAAGGAMGLGAGGKMRQKIYPDPHGLDTWDPENYGTLFVHIVNSEQYQELTGREPPPTPIDAATYTEYGFPWFDLYDEEWGDVEASERLAQVKTVRAKDLEKGSVPGGKDEQSAKIDPAQVKGIKPRRSDKRR